MEALGIVTSIAIIMIARLRVRLFVRNFETVKNR
jgi:hypothetical protein